MEKRSNINSQFVTFEIASKLKELGFDEITFTYFKEDNTLEEDVVCVNGSVFWNIPDIKEVAAPLHQQAISWLFKKLDFYYPYLKFETYSDGSGSWYQSKDEFNDKLEIVFDCINEGILLGIEALEKFKAK